MPETMNPLKAIRSKVVEILTDATITVQLASGPKVVTMLEHPPASGLISDSRLPGIYVYCRSEIREQATNQTDLQRVLVDIVLQSLGADIDAVDHVDDMQLAVEMALISDPRLGGLVYDFRAVGSETDTEKGEVNFAMRRVTYEGRRHLDRLSPSVTV